MPHITPQDKQRQERLEKWEKIKEDIPEATYSRTLENLAILDPKTDYLKAKKTLKEAKEIALVKADERIARVKAEQEVHCALKTALFWHVGRCSISYRRSFTFASCWSQAVDEERRKYREYWARREAEVNFCPISMQYTPNRSACIISYLSQGCSGTLI